MYFIILSTFLLLPAGNIVIGLLRRRQERRKGDTSVLTTLAACAGVLDGLAIGVIVLLSCAMVDGRWYSVVCFIACGILLEALLVLFMLHKWRLKWFAVWCLAALLCAGGIYGIFRYDRYVASITMPEYFDYRTYRPFSEGSLVKELGEEPTLKFGEGDDLPRMDGATALYPVYAAFAQAVYPGSCMDEPDGGDSPYSDEVVKCSTTTGAYRDIVDGKRDIIFVAGPSEEQEQYAKEKGVELAYTPIGREAFVFFVHPENPIEGLTLDEIRGIYSGKIARWDELGVKGLGDIAAYQRDKNSGSQTALERFVMRDTPLAEPRKNMVQSSMGGMVEVVSDYRNTKGAIGYSFRFYCTELMKGFRVKLLDVEGVSPTVENIKNGSYRLASEFYAVTRSGADENTRRLVEWITGPQGQKLVEKTGYVPMAGN